MTRPTLLVVLFVLAAGCAQAPAGDVVACVPATVTGYWAVCPLSRDRAPTATEDSWQGCEGPQWIVDETGCRVFRDETLTQCTAQTASIACPNGDVLRCGWALIPTDSQCIQMAFDCPQGGCLYDAEAP